MGHIGHMGHMGRIGHMGLEGRQVGLYLSYQPPFRYMSYRGRAATKEFNAKTQRRKDL